MRDSARRAGERSPVTASNHPSGPAVGGRAATPSFFFREPVTEEPEHRGPEPDEKRSTLGVAALLLVNRLCANPQADAKPDSSD